MLVAANNSTTNGAFLTTELKDWHKSLGKNTPLGVGAKLRRIQRDRFPYYLGNCSRKQQI